MKKKMYVVIVALLVMVSITTITVLAKTGRGGLSLA